MEMVLASAVIWRVVAGMAVLYGAVLTFWVVPTKKTVSKVRDDFNDCQKTNPAKIGRLEERMAGVKQDIARHEKTVADVGKMNATVARIEGKVSGLCTMVENLPKELNGKV